MLLQRFLIISSFRYHFASINFDKISIVDVDGDLPGIYLRFYAKFGAVELCGLAYTDRETHRQVHQVLNYV